MVDPISKADSTTSAISEPNQATAEELLKKAQEAQNEIETIKDQYEQYLTPEELASLEFYRAETKGMIAALDYYSKTGTWAGYGALDGTAGPLFGDLSSIPYGWAANTNGVTSPVELQGVAGDESKGDGEYVGTISIEAGGATGAIMFTAKSSDDPSENMLDIVGKTAGKDIIVTITYEDGHKEFYVIKDGAVRNDFQIWINALKMDHKVRIDFSRVIRTDKFGRTGVAVTNSDGTQSVLPSFVIIGTRRNDTIFGSHSEDNINGAGGADTIDGMGAGDATDHVYGFASPEMEEAFGTNLGKDGNDTIYDIDGRTTIVSGAGADDMIVRGNTTGPTGDTTAEREVRLDQSAPNANFVNGSGWKTTNENGEIVIEKSGSGDKININLEELKDEGFDMASASYEGQDLILTVVGFDKNGLPKYFRIRIKDFLKDGSNTTLNIRGSFVDMHAVEVGYNTVNLTGTDSDGDVLIQAKTKWDELKIDPSQVDGKSTATTDELKKLLEDSKIKGEKGEEDKITFGGNDEGWKSANVNADGEIVLEAKDRDYSGINKVGDSSAYLDFTAPAGYTDAAFVRIEGNDVVLIMVGKGDSQGEANLAVVRMVGAASAYSSGEFVVKVDGLSTNVNTIGAIGTLNGGAGSDLLMSSKYSSTDADVDDEVVEVRHPTSPKP